MEPMNKVIEDFKSKFEKLGLYMVDVNVASSDEEINDADEDGNIKDFRKKLADGESMMVLMGTFTIGDVAFSDRVLDPEKEKADTEFAVAVPEEWEIEVARIKRLGLAAFEPDADEESD
jgi:hypothetical protein